MYSIQLFSFVAFVQLYFSDRVLLNAINTHVYINVQD